MTETTPVAAVGQATGPDDSVLLRFVADSLDALVSFFDTQTRRCRFANAAYASLYGFTRESIVGCCIEEIVGAAAWAEIEPHVQRCQAGECVNFLREHRRHDGSVLMLNVALTPYLDVSGRQTGLLSVITDTTQHWEAERSVRESEERTRKFAAATEEAIVFHCDGVMLDCNDAMTRLTGFSRNEIVGRNIFDFISPAYRSTALEYTRSASEYLYEVCIVHRDGHEIPIEVMGKTMPQHGADYRVVVVRDITARKNMQEREAFLALHDALTELLNRRALLEQLSLALAQARSAQTPRQKQVAVLVINLDHFKTINDSLGHAVGDQILCALAQRLRACVAERGFIARPGGDEFVIVLPSADRSAAAQLANELFPALAQPLAVAHTSVSLSASIGISLFPDDEKTGPGLLRQAEAALRHAKESGRGNQQFSAPGMAGEAMAALQLERDLRSAMAGRQLVLHYQPVVHVASGKLAGFEALVRWQHPERGLLEPAEFIAFAETHGLITPIGRWVMLDACRQLKAWHDAGLPRVPVAVNLSAFEFRQRDVAGEIAAVLAETGLEPQFLEVELTETALMQQSDQVLQTLQAIEALGVGIAIDDFGTGYSSLAYLKRYPIAKLKIDRSFVMDTPGSSDDVAIVTAIVELGRSLKLRTVAEGVEQADQLALLARLGCDLAQGYGIARPMDAAQTQTWLEQQR